MKFSVSKLCVLGVLTGLIFMGARSRATPTLSPATGALSPAGNKVMIYPTATETIDQLRQKGITNVRNYGSYWLVQATDAQVNELTQLYGARAVKANDLNRIRLRNLSFDTTEGEPTVPVGLRQKELTGKNLRLIQFCGPVMPQWLQQIQSVGDVEVVSYVPNNAYLIRVDQPAEKKLRALAGPGGPIQWLGAYHPFYKIEPGLVSGDHGRDDPLVNVGVMVAPHSENSDTMKGIEKIGFVDYSYNRGNLTTLFMTVPVSTITQMAKLRDVVWIEKEYPKKLLDEVQGLVLAGQTNGIGHGPEGATTGFTNYLDFLLTQVAGNLTNTFIDSSTYPVVDVADSGIDSGPFSGTVIVETNALGNPPAVAQFGVEGPVHPSFHEFGDARNPSRVLYYGPPWVAGDPSPQLGCNVYFINDGFFKHAESMDLVGHGTAVASIIAGYDDGTNTLNKPCLQLISASNTWRVIIPGTTSNLNSGATEPTVEVDPVTGQTFTIPGNFCASFDSAASFGGYSTTNITVLVPMGFTNTCGPGGAAPGMTFSNMVVGVVTNQCPTNLLVTVFYTAIQTNRLSETRVDANGNQLGMGISPFGLLGNSRIWEDYSKDAALSGPPGTASFGALGGNFGCQTYTFLLDTGKCITDIPSLMAVAYTANGFETPGARIQNNSWSDNIGIPPLNGGQYDADCVSYDVGVRDALLVGLTNNIIPGLSPLNQEFIVVFAAASSFFDAGNNSGNGGFPDIVVTAPATAKNVISVGVADNPHFDFCGGGDSLVMPTYAANGPTLDHRFKPEIVAPGANVSAALSQIIAVSTNCVLDKLTFPEYPGIIACTNPPCDGGQAPIYTDLYSCFFGSSYAAPAVSGSIQLLWWYFQNRLTDELGNPILQPSPAMAKAYVCNAARYLPIADPFHPSVLDTLPSDLQGMGELDLGRMFDGMARVIRDESSPRAISVPLTTTNPAPQQTYFSQSGQTYTLTGQIASNNQPFRVTLAWIDPPGLPGAAQELVNNLDLAVVINGVTYKGNVFAKNVSVSRDGDAFDSVNNMESVFLNPLSMLNGIPVVSNGTPFQVTVTATDIAGRGVPNVGEAPPVPPGATNASQVLNQDFALVVYNAMNASDVPNLATNNSCSTAMDVTTYPFSFTNTMNSATYHQAFPSPTAGTGGPEEFFRIPLPTPGAQISVDTIGTGFDNVLSVWEVQVIPQTILVRGECGALTEVVSANGVNNQSQVSFTADGTNDYFIVVEPHNYSGTNGTVSGQMVLNVTGSAPITLSPTSLAFTNNPLEVVGATSTNQQVRYLNGTTVPVTIKGVSITGPGSNDFVITAQNCANDTLQPGGNCSVNVAFAPTTNGTRQANLLFTDDAVGSPRIVVLTGTAQAPAPVVCLSSGASLNFSSQTIGSTSAVQSVTITNCGSLPLIVSNVTVSGSGSLDFLVNAPASTNLSVGSTLTIPVTFAPTRSGTRQATLVIPNNTINGAATVALQGVGEAPAPGICLSSSSINFGSISVGSTSTVQSLIITSCGTAPLVISSVTISSGNTTDFTVVASTCTTVATGDTCTVNLQFNPTAGGARSATLSIVDNASGSPHLVTLSAAGALSQPDAAIGKTIKLKKMVGFGVINTTGIGQELSQNVHRQTPKAIESPKHHGVKYYIAIENIGSVNDQFAVQSAQISGGQGWTVNYFLGTKSSDNVDITAAVNAGTFATGTLAPGAVTGDSTMLLAEVSADKTVVARGTTAIFTLTFTSASNPTSQDTVRITAVAK